MKHADFKALCQREWDNGFGVVKRLYLDDNEYQDLVDDLNVPGGELAGVVNTINGDVVPVVRHRNRAIVERQPQPAATEHTVYL